MNSLIKSCTNKSNEIMRLDKLLTEFAKDDELLKNWSRSRLKNLIESGAVLVNGKKATKAGALIKPGELIEITPVASVSREIKPLKLEIEKLYEDDFIIAINKPPGISVHAGAGNKDYNLVNALRGYFEQDVIDKDSVRAGIVHRLDKDTTGVIIVAKNLDALTKFSELFSRRKIKKTYISLVLNTPRSKRLVGREDNGVIESGIIRDKSNRLKMAIDLNRGKKALTEWKVIERMSYACLVTVNLLTGRTHQIRVHFNHLQSPVIGDLVYGNFEALPPKLKKITLEFGRQALHAEKLEFEHPFTNKLIEIKAAIPADMEKLINEFRNYR